MDHVVKMVDAWQHRLEQPCVFAIQDILVQLVIFVIHARQIHVKTVVIA